jgi:hypothetical protein
LGDEVNALLSLLEKIYIELDHYSPILQNYPGVSFLLFLLFLTFRWLHYFIFLAVFGLEELLCGSNQLSDTY